MLKNRRNVGFRKNFGWICKEMMILIYIASLKHISCQIFNKWTKQESWDFINPPVPFSLMTPCTQTTPLNFTSLYIKRCVKDVEMITLKRLACFFFCQNKEQKTKTKQNKTKKKKKKKNRGVVGTPLRRTRVKSRRRDFMKRKRLSFQWRMSIISLGTCFFGESYKWRVYFQKVLNPLFIVLRKFLFL